MLGVTKYTGTGEYSVQAGLNLGYIVPTGQTERFKQDFNNRLADVFGSSAWQRAKSDMSNMAQTGVLHSAADMLTRLSEAVRTALQEKKHELESHGTSNTHGSLPATTDRTAEEDISAPREAKGDSEPHEASRDPAGSRNTST